MALRVVTRDAACCCGAAKVPVACFLGASSWLYVCHDGLDMSCHGVAAVPLR